MNAERFDVIIVGAGAAGLSWPSRCGRRCSPHGRVERLVDSAHMHDWQADPCSRGAYSYAAVGGRNAHAALAKPLKNTLFFAGEATSGDATGTVAGAFALRRASAQRAKSCGCNGDNRGVTTAEILRRLRGSG